MLAGDSPPGTQVAGVLTRSKTAAAPVEWRGKVLLPRAGSLARVANSGYGNEATGAAGRDAVRAIARLGRLRLLDCQVQEVFVASTGVIGEPFRRERSRCLLGELVDSGAAGGWRKRGRSYHDDRHISENRDGAEQIESTG